ncbi:MULTISPECIES: TetR/AcrR family transcriptional regulator [Streptomyces]|uniref:TetR/AcrR family transcriptional regulator n=1 Tax=Streptomyces caniscabiei TaxID=2746961 RepID=A0ABU4MYI7_9ACTN|nr:MULTISPECIES: TetR/AcrR family transcriptional regulator [Streptomyces]MBE4733364.1 TetR/AcrR family transcriptional regulator [Streptomyces caniscabiei]MBE4754542.1 TetR/AcrR family transcriptional regulator [Streptomyces caniscabiei]MBE4768637.1 TetR/AcrR family transcriptional regulator [Streptomyces caniscabiei]MBE4781859.1 TetR/AcrR family transcriptional regulator [Streptomyces caniscabiei]MBE4793149.1 TetR/AcrR family transcriptional regulator [Streptomyces caniscabiei]
MTTSKARAAHRPSRKQWVIEAATELFATQPPDEVTVADIAARAEMTSAAVYYHFSSKDQVLAEGMRVFADALREQLRTLADAHEPGSDIGPAVTTLLAWLGEHRSAATVFFVSSAGMSQEAEALRLESRTNLLAELVRLIHKARESVTEAEAAVIGLGLLALLETAAISQVRGDDVYRSLGHRSFVREVDRLAERIADAAVAG